MSAASDQTYQERIRHPNGALNPSRSKDETRGRWLWILLGLAVFGYFAWRSGSLDRIIASAKAGMSAVKPIANPQGWIG